MATIARVSTLADQNSASHSRRRHKGLVRTFCAAWGNLKALAVATDPRDGIDLEALERALSDYPVTACWVMTNSQNPLGCTAAALSGAFD